MLVLETKLPCAVCKKPGERRAIEGLPHNGILWRCTHDDGSEAHEWSRYKSFEDLSSQRETNPAEMICPRCKQNGTISAWREDPTNKPERYQYTIKHYYNLESKNYSKQCHMITQEYRDIILKRLGRYIAPAPTTILKPTLPRSTRLKEQDTKLANIEALLSQVGEVPRRKRGFQPGHTFTPRHRHHSPQSIKKMSLSHMGHKPWNKDKPHSLKAKKKMREGMRLAHARRKEEQKTFLSFEEARKIVISFTLKTIPEYHIWRKSTKRPNNISSNPDRFYKREWRTWGYWLGTDSIAS